MTLRQPSTRRDILIGAAAAGLGLATRTLPAGAEAVVETDVAATYSEQYVAAFERLVAGRTPAEAGISLEIPEVAENGNIVPYKIAAESPMTPESFVARLHLLSTANPEAVVAVFHLTPQSGRAAVTGRMRLAKTQDVIALAEDSTGRLSLAKVNVKVMIGGCGI